MTETTQDLTETNPFETLEGTAETNGEFVRFELTVHPSPSAGPDAADLPHARWAVDAAEEHVNPKVEEFFEVLVGEYEVAIEGEAHRLTEGEGITIPRGVPHEHYNPSDRPSRIRYEARPACGMDEALESVFTLAQAGRTNEQGLPNILQLAVIQDAYPGTFYSTDLPVGVQKALFKILAPIGRLAGYEATYSRTDVDALR